MKDDLESLLADAADAFGTIRQTLPDLLARYPEDFDPDHLDDRDLPDLDELAEKVSEAEQALEDFREAWRKVGPRVGRYLETLGDAPEAVRERLADEAEAVRAALEAEEEGACGEAA